MPQENQDQELQNEQPPVNTRDLLDALRREFHEQQTTPIQDKKLTVPLALAACTVIALVGSTWKVSSFYETEVNSRIQAGIREREYLKRELTALKTDLKLTKERVGEIKQTSDDNARDLDYIWRREREERPRSN